MPWPQNIPIFLKMKFEGWRVVVKVHFVFDFFNSYFLNCQYSSSFHVTGKQMTSKYLCLAPEELSKCQTAVTAAAHV